VHEQTCVLEGALAGTLSLVETEVPEVPRSVFAQRVEKWIDTKERRFRSRPMEIHGNSKNQANTLETVYGCRGGKTNNGEGDCFVTEFSVDGRYLVYSTFLGGSDWDNARGIAVENGTAYVTGYTRSSDFPTVNAYDSTFNIADCFVAVLAYRTTDVLPTAVIYVGVGIAGIAAVAVIVLFMRWKSRGN
jgi:hypothetical protein